MTITKSLCSAGWIRNSHSSERGLTFGGTRYGTLEKNHVRLAFSVGRCLQSHRGDVWLYESDEKDVVLVAIVCDEEFRKRGFASNAMLGVVSAADACSVNIFVEPVSFGSYRIAGEILGMWYEQYGFVWSPCRRFMSRCYVPIAT